MTSILSRVFSSSTRSIETPGVSVEDINKRTAIVERIQRIFNNLQPGQKLVNASQFLEKLKAVQQAMDQDYAKLYNPNIKVTAEIEQARAALAKQIAALQKVEATANSAKIIPDSKHPWDGKLRDDKDTPLHWAVRNHKLEEAVNIGSEVRRIRLHLLCHAYAKSVKDAKIAAILNNPNIMPRLIDAIELLHVQNHLKLDAKNLQVLFKGDPDILAVIQDPDFRKFLANPIVQRVLNNLLILSDIDTNGLSPLDEALLQNDPEMVKRLLFPQHFKNEKLHKIFSAHIEELQGRMAAMRRVDPNDLSDVCKAAYLGNVNQLMMETNFNQRDAKGLTPFHYAILGGKIESIEYLLNRTDTYSLTPEGHSYLDYAIITGHEILFNHFHQLKLPFKLGSEQESFSYLFASGIVQQQLAAIAKTKDPLAMGGQDQNFAGINLNALWAGTALFNISTGLDKKNSWIGWFGHNLQDLTNSFNRHAVGTGQILNMMPTWAARPFAKAYFYYQNAVLPAILLYAAGTSLALKSGYKQEDIDEALKPYGKTFGNVTDVVSKSFTVLRMIGAVKPVIDRLPVYRKNFTSRPTAVMKCIAYDAFNLGTQALMSYSNWPLPQPDVK